MNETTMERNYEYIGEDYVHSANSLFHFVTKSQYLFDDLKRKALCPRYCNEDVGYLNINYNGVTGQWVPSNISYSEVLKRMPRLKDRIRFKMDLRRKIK